MQSKHLVEQTKSQAREKSSVGAEISKVGVTAIAAFAGCAGCWAVVSLFAGTLGSGGPVGLAGNLVTAIFG